MSPKLRNLLIALITAVAAAVVAYLQGCSPANLQQADRVFEAAQAQLACVRDVRAHNEALLLDPESVTLASGKQLANDLRACLPSNANAADAGY
jgi:hypothetical protein